MLRAVMKLNWVVGLYFTFRLGKQGIFMSKF